MVERPAPSRTRVAVVVLAAFVALAAGAVLFYREGLDRAAQWAGILAVVSLLWAPARRPGAGGVPVDSSASTSPGRAAVSTPAPHVLDTMITVGWVGTTPRQGRIPQALESGLSALAPDRAVRLRLSP